MTALVPYKHNEAIKTIDLIIENTTIEEKRLLLDLLDSLIEIRRMEISKREKIKRTIMLFKKSKSALPLLKNIKPFLWDNRGWGWKTTLVLTIAVATLVPGNAGIAAMGTAIGVPLWVVIGGGYGLATIGAEKLRSIVCSTKKSDIIDATFTVMGE